MNRSGSADLLLRRLLALTGRFVSCKDVNGTGGAVALDLIDLIGEIRGEKRHSISYNRGRCNRHGLAGGDEVGGSKENVGGDADVDGQAGDDD